MFIVLCCFYMSTVLEQLDRTTGVLKNVTHRKEKFYKVLSLIFSGIHLKGGEYILLVSTAM